MILYLPFVLKFSKLILFELMLDELFFSTVSTLVYVLWLLLKLLLEFLFVDFIIVDVKLFYFDFDFDSFALTFDS